MKQATFIIDIESYHDVSLARLLLHASRALDQQAKAEGLTTSELLDNNLAKVNLNGFMSAVHLTVDPSERDNAIHFNLAPRSQPR